MKLPEYCFSAICVLLYFCCWLNSVSVLISKCMLFDNIDVNHVMYGIADWKFWDLRSASLIYWL